MRYLAVALTFAALLLAPITASAASISITPGRDGATRVLVSGKLLAGDGSAFASQTEMVGKAVVWLNSSGGDLTAALSIGDTIARQGFATFVPAWALCASGCALAWLAGNPRTMESGARIGFHTAYNPETRQESVVGNARVGAYLTRLGLPKAVDYVTAAPPVGMTWLDPAEAEQYGVTVYLADSQGPPARPAVPPLPAAKVVKTEVVKTEVVEPAAPPLRPNELVKTEVIKRWDPAQPIGGDGPSGSESPIHPKSVVTTKESFNWPGDNPIGENDGNSTTKAPERFPSSQPWGFRPPKVAPDTWGSRVPVTEPGGTSITEKDRPVPPPVEPLAPPTSTQVESPIIISVPMKAANGIFVVPVEINSAMTVDFAVDSGAAVVVVSADVFSNLKLWGTVQESDIIGPQTFTLADGSAKQWVTFTIRSLRVGSVLIENVKGAIAPSEKAKQSLLGQSFLERFKGWSIDNATHKLVLEKDVEARPATAPVTALPFPPVDVGWVIQVGAFPAEPEARLRLSSVQSLASRYLTNAHGYTETVTKGDAVFFRVRFGGLSKEQAEAICTYLKHNDVDCRTIGN